MDVPKRILFENSTYFFGVLNQCIHNNSTSNRPQPLIFFSKGSWPTIYTAHLNTITVPISIEFSSKFLFMLSDFQLFERNFFRDLKLINKICDIYFDDIRKIMLSFWKRISKIFCNSIFMYLLGIESIQLIWYVPAHVNSTGLMLIHTRTFIYIWNGIQVINKRLKFSLSTLLSFFCVCFPVYKRQNHYYDHNCLAVMFNENEKYYDKTFSFLYFPLYIRLI